MMENARTLSPRQMKFVLVLAIVIAATRLLAVAASLNDWDEALFTLAVREYDVGQHHPHPPGYPLYVAAAKAIRLLGAPEFRSLQTIVVLGAMGIFPAVFFFARAVGFDFPTSVGGAAIFAFLPNVWVYGGTGFSDVPAAALTLTACALLLRGRGDSRSYLLGAVLLGVAAGFRPASLLIGFVPGVLATIARWREARGIVLTAALAGALIAGGSYVGAAYATGSPERYLFAVREQRKYVRDIDSWRSPDRPPLSKVAESFFLWPVRQRQQMAGLALLATISLLVAARSRRREPLLTLAIFGPIAVTTWLNLDVATAARYAISYMPVHALLAADGLGIVSRGRARAQVAACGVVVAIFVVWTWPALRLQRTTYAPPFAALDWIAHNVPETSTVYVPSGYGPHALVVIPRHRVVWYDKMEDISALSSDTWIVDLTTGEGAMNFEWPRNSLEKIIRRRSFEVSVARGTQTVLFGSGWYDEEGEGENSFRWMAGQSSAMLPGLKARGRLAMRIQIPLDSVARRPVIEVTLGGRLLEKFDAVEPVMDKFWITPAYDQPVELIIRTSETFNPARLGKSHDARDLGLRVDTLSWTAVR